MKQFTETEFIFEIEKIFKMVFSNSNPFDKPFQPRIKNRLLLYPYRWFLSEPWLTPIVDTMEFLGEEGFYVSALSRPQQDNNSHFFHWYIPLSEIYTYGPLVYSQQNAVYSVNGLWGIICSDEDHALIGGSKILINNIEENVSDLDFRIQEFLKMWNSYYQTNGVSINWICPMLIHVFGKKVAREILVRNNFEFLL